MARSSFFLVLSAICKPSQIDVAHLEHDGVLLAQHDALGQRPGCGIAVVAAGKVERHQIVFGDGLKDRREPLLLGRHVDPMGLLPPRIGAILRDDAVEEVLGIGPAAGSRCRGVIVNELVGVDPPVLVHLAHRHLDALEVELVLVDHLADQQVGDAASAKLFGRVSNTSMMACQSRCMAALPLLTRRGLPSLRISRLP